MDRDQRGGLTSLPPPLAALLVAGALVLGAPAGAGAQVTDQTTVMTASSTTSTAATTTSLAPSTSAITITTTPPASDLTARQAREQGNVWIVVVATLAMIAALVAIAVIQRRRGPSRHAPTAGGGSGASVGPAPPAPKRGAQRAGSTAGPTAKPKPKPAAGGAGKAGARSTPRRRRPPAKRKPRKR